MFIPVGLDRTSVRRVPWITIIIIVINVLVLAYSWYELKSNERLFRKVGDYYYDHPYLNVPESFAHYVFAYGYGGWLENTLEKHKGRILEPGETGGDSEEQKTFEKLAAELDSKLQGLVSGRHGFIPAKASPLRSITALFLHANFWHVFGNMLFLFIVGPFLEDIYGRPLFAILYLLGGFAADLPYVLLAPDSTGVGIGASGAIAALMGAFLVRFAKTEIRFFFSFFFTVPKILTARAFVLLPLWLLVQLLGPILAPRSHVGFLAHIAGFLFGVIAAGFMKLSRIEENYIDPAIEKKIGVSENPLRRKARMLLEAEKPGEAFQCLQSALKDDLKNPDIRLEAAEAALALGKKALAARHFGEDVMLHMKAGNVLTACRDLLAALSKLGDVELPPKALFELGKRSEKLIGVEESTKILEFLVRKYPDTELTPKALLHLGDLYLLRLRQPRQAREYFEKARSHPRLHPQMIPAVDEMVLRCRP